MESWPYTDNVCSSFQSKWRLYSVISWKKHALTIYCVLQNELQNKEISSHEVLPKIYTLKRLSEPCRKFLSTHRDRLSGVKQLTDSRSFTVLRTRDELLKTDPDHFQESARHLTFRQQGLYHEHSRAVYFSRYLNKVWLVSEVCAQPLYPWGLKL